MLNLAVWLRGIARHNMVTRLNLEHARLAIISPHYLPRVTVSRCHDSWLDLRLHFSDSSL